TYVVFARLLPVPPSRSSGQWTLFCAPKASDLLNGKRRPKHKPHPEEAAKPPSRRMGLMVRDAPNGAPHHDATLRCARDTRFALVGRRDVFVVDQIVDRLLDVDISREHARLLQGDTGLQDRVAL